MLLQSMAGELGTEGDRREGSNDGVQAILPTWRASSSHAFP